MEGLCNRSYAYVSTGSINDGWRSVLLNRLSKLLPTLQQDPLPACRLISALIRPDTFSFDMILSIEPKVDFVSGLLAPSPPINLMTLDLLGRATSNRSDVGIFAGMADVVLVLVRAWLCADDVAVHQRAQSVLEACLVGPQSSELMWRRLLGDKDVYGLIFSICSLKPIGREGWPSKNKKTIAQGRLLALLPKIDSHELRVSQCREVEEKYGANSLLDFATLKMVDYKDDVLMHMTLIQLFTDWLRESAMKKKAKNLVLLSAEDSSPALDYLIENGVHSRTVQLFTQPSNQDSWDARHLRSSSAEYLEVYLSLYSEHALGPGKEVLKSAVDHIWQVLDNTSPSMFMSYPPTTELGVLVRIPPVALLVQGFSSPSLISRIPIQPANALSFDVLTKVFGGRHPHQCTKAAARVLYFMYMIQHPAFWAFTIKSADTLALKDAAVAAGRLVLSVINADWESMENLLITSRFSETSFPIRTERDLTERCHAQSLPPTGFLTVLTSPALESVIPWLLSPAQRPTDLGVSGKGDADGAANSVAEVKYDALQKLYRKLEEHSMAHGADPAWQDILLQMRKRLAQGRWGGLSEVGGSVATSQRS